MTNEQRRRSEPVVDFEAFETVATFGDAVQAHLCRMALQQAGVDAWLSTENLAGVHPPLGLAIGVGVLVRPEEAAAARDLLRAADRGRLALPDEPET